MLFRLSTPPLRSAHGYTCVFYESGSPVALRTPPLPRNVYTTVPDIDTTVPKQIMSDSDYLTMNPQVDLIRFSQSSFEDFGVQQYRTCGA